MNYQRARSSDRKEERRTAILEAAKRRFASQGLTDTGIDQIAGDCGLSRALVYTYFLDMRHLFLAVVSQALETLYGEFESAARDQPDGLEAITSIGMGYVAFARTKPEYYDAILRFRFETPPTPLSPDGKRDALIASYNGTLENVARRAQAIDRLMVGEILRGQKDGSIGMQGDPQALGGAVWSMVAGLIQAKGSEVALVEAGMAIAKAGLRHGPMLFPNGPKA